MKKFILLTAVLTIYTAAMAQKLGHTDGQALLLALPEMSKIDSSLQKQTKEYESTLNTMKAEYDVKIKDFEASQTANAPQAILQSKARVIQGLEQNMVDLQETANSDLAASRDQMLRPLIDKVNKAIDAVAKENDFTYIFDSGTGSLLYLGGEDITLMVMDKLGIKKPEPKPVAPKTGK
ncbi:MAG: OmpH family outer membrane protein [Crocinitomicaceae bacterium]|nr:OmpH family outer membrane protein [Crocinitomicaceae bacterium]